MTTFEGLVYAIIHGITEFLPIGASAHHILVPFLTGLNPPNETLMTALGLGSFLAVLIYFRHDWASLISSLLQVLIFRRYPTALDERLPFFIALACLPVAGSWIYLREILSQRFLDPSWAAASLAVFGIILALSDHFGRKNKGTFDWNWLDALLLGVAQSLMFIPGCGLLTGAFCAGLFRNYRREAAAKFSFFVVTPLLAAGTVHGFRSPGFQTGSAALDGLSWLTFSVVVLVTLLAALLAINGFMKQIQKVGPRPYVVYRLMMGLGVLIWIQAKQYY